LPFPNQKSVVGSADEGNMLPYVGHLEKLQQELGGKIYRVLGSGINSNIYAHLLNAKDISKICVFIVEWYHVEDTALMEIRNSENDILRSHCNNKLYPLLWHCL
jgi:hypothetical protein